MFIFHFLHRTVLFKEIFNSKNILFALFLLFCPPLYFVNVFNVANFVVLQLKYLFTHKKYNSSVCSQLNQSGFFFFFFFVRISFVHTVVIHSQSQCVLTSPIFKYKSMYITSPVLKKLLSCNYILVFNSI